MVCVSEDGKAPIVNPAVPEWTQQYYYSLSNYNLETFLNTECNQFPSKHTVEEQMVVSVNCKFTLFPHVKLKDLHPFFWFK